jgi:hypothetical protein
MVVYGGAQPGRIAAADVLKISALVRERDISVKQMFLTFGDVAENDTVTAALTVSNGGTSLLTVSGIESASRSISCGASLPVGIPPMQSVNLPIRFCSRLAGAVADTIVLTSDDPATPILKIPFTANVLPYFVVADNDNPLAYAETGSWSNSVATDCYGATSRFAPIGTTARARFTATLLKSGIYDVQGILPKTANASMRARYSLRVNNVVTDSLFRDQNAGSGTWVTLYRRTFPARVPIGIDITDASINTTDNLVLRADAIRFSLKLETGVRAGDNAVLPAAFALEQNYPNPFNPSTTIHYDLPTRSTVRLEVFNTVGQRVAVLAEGVHEAGRYGIVWNAQAPSGLYFARIHAQAVGASAPVFTVTRKMLLLR